MNIPAAISQFAHSHLSSLLTIVIVYLIGELLLTLLARKLTAQSTQPNGKNRNKRATTIGRLIHGTGRAVLFLVFAFWLLRIFGVDPTPLLASAGVAGLAIGFGAQALVKDVITGLFILAENQYSVGDTIKIGEHQGVVEHFSMRATVLRDADGNAVFIPNGTITTVVNIQT